MGRNCNCMPESGDHIYCRRKGGLYYHHGIYVGDNMVIHLAGKAKKLQPPSCQECRNKEVINGEIAKICINCFLRGENFFVYDYGVSYFKYKTSEYGTCCRRASRPPDEVIGAAVRFLEHEGFGGYDVFANNCEDFAVYCKTGFAESNQIMGRIRALAFLFPIGLIAAVPVALAYSMAKVITSIRRRDSPS